MIPNAEKEGGHYLAVKQSSTLLRGITSKNNGDFYDLNCLRSFRVESKLKFQKKYVTRKIFAGLLCKLKKVIY